MTKVFDDVSYPYHYIFKEPCSQVKDVINDRIKLAIDNEYTDGLYEYSNAIKYLLRWPAKNGLHDLKKCRECVDKLIEHVENYNV